MALTISQKKRVLEAVVRAVILAYDLPHSNDEERVYRNAMLDEVIEKARNVYYNTKSRNA